MSMMAHNKITQDDGQDRVVRKSFHLKAARMGIAGALALIAGGCAMLFPDPPPPTFDLKAAQTFSPPGAGAGRGTLIVVTPQAIQTVDSQRMVVRQGTQISYVPGGQWADSLPNLLQARLVQSFENGGRLAAVGRPEDRLTPDYQLLTDIRAFEINASATPVALVELSVKIVGEQAGRVIAAKVFRAELPASAVTGEAASAALDTALTQVLAEIVAWGGTRI